MRLRNLLFAALPALLAGPPVLAAAPDATVVEYYRAAVDHYFMTAYPNEQALLDSGAIPGWVRTGVTFAAWSDAAHAPPEAHPVCRFYGRPEAGLDSHFYSAFVDECDAVLARFPAAWILEAPNVFYIDVPDRTTGACPADTDPIYRVFDNRSDVDHRYLISLVLRAPMEAKGWVPEGYGPDAVVMCAPKSAGAPPPDQPLADPSTYSTLPGASLANAVDAASVTHHTIVLGGTTIGYTASAGHLVVRDPQSGQAQASMFYVAYVADGQDAATRPVTFFYNGGPGSATVWLHLGSFGPKRLATGDPATTLPVPFALVDNSESLLDTTDLVFVDAVGSGYSEAIAPYTNQSHWGVDNDAAVFRNFIDRYVAVNGRASSPKFLFGESYGTTRSAVLAKELELGGTTLAGVVLQSSVLNYNSNCGVVNVASVSCAGYVPTYGSVGAYYGLLDPNPLDLASFRSGIASFTTSTYAPADASYLATLMPPDPALVATLSDITGAAQSLWQANFNLDPGTYQFDLIPHELIGRYDARVSAPFGTPLASEGDPSSTLISGSFANEIQGYLQSFVGYSNLSQYVVSSNAISTWNFAHDGQPLPDAIPDLAAAMTLNPALKILSLNGYHDLATPYFQTVLDLSRLGPTSAVEIRFYDGGHMTYLDDTSRPLEKADLRAWYRAVLSAAAQGAAR